MWWCGGAVVHCLRCCSAAVLRSAASVHVTCPLARPSTNQRANIVIPQLTRGSNSPRSFAPPSPERTGESITSRKSTSPRLPSATTSPGAGPSQDHDSSATVKSIQSRDSFTLGLRENYTLSRLANSTTNLPRHGLSTFHRDDARETTTSFQHCELTSLPGRVLHCPSRLCDANGSAPERLPDEQACGVGR